MAVIREKPFVVKRINIVGTGTQGPQGPQGPPGPPGDSVAFPIDSDNVDYDGQTLTSILDLLTYTAININSFSNNVGKLEVGSQLDSINLNWSLNKTPVSQTITGTNVSSTPVAPGTTSQSFVGIGYDPDAITTAQYNLSVDDGTNTDNASTSVQFLNRRYWAALPLSPVSNSFILSMNKDGISSMQNSRVKTFTVSAGSSEYIWYCYPSRLGLSTIKDASTGFAIDMQSPVLFSFTNASGYTENYYVYRSTFDNLGNITVQVT